MKVWFFALCGLAVILCFGELLLKNNFSVSENGSYSVFFCPRDNCESLFLSYIRNASSVSCALYSLDSNELWEELVIHPVAMHHTYFDRLNASPLWHRIEHRGLQHNKFCVLDEHIVLTGSTNPTYNGFYKNPNNIVVIDSVTLAGNYLHEFEELAYGGESASVSSIVLNGALIENYFCPEDDCETQLLRVLSSAQESVYFMTYSFTSDAIGDSLIRLSLSGVHVEGLFARSQISSYSEYARLLDMGVEVSKYGGVGKLHHKVFIIDRSIVVTGSYNPTRNGNEFNDENVLIIHDEDVALEFLYEYSILLNKSLKPTNS